MYNTYLSVVNYPDSMGADCDFQPYSFYLGGNRTYYGLPNNPNYGLGALAGSACDTLTGIVPTPSLPTKEGELNLYFDAGWQKLFVNGHHIKGSSCLLQVFDVSGKLVYSNQNKITPPYYTHDVNCQSLSKGMYLVSLQTDKEKLQGRFVK
ncbi:MAG TPA: T9SS type A sorting domain-containing protein, partial [Bacteroidia bacterium]|nr:T9SS type A sorting domain-containing protein [Bacteroidia bacterium]